MYRTVVTICTTSLTFTTPRSAHTAVFICFVWISEQTAIISLYNINWLVFVTETESVYCAVRTWCLNINQVYCSAETHFHRRSTLMFLHMLPLPEGQTREFCKLSNKQCSSGSQSTALYTTERSLFGISVAMFLNQQEITLARFSLSATLHSSFRGSHIISVLRQTINKGS